MKFFRYENYFDDSYNKTGLTLPQIIYFSAFCFRLFLYIIDLIQSISSNNFKGIKSDIAFHWIIFSI